MKSLSVLISRISLIILIITSCTKNDIPVNIFSGKIKSIEFRDSANNGAILYLEYDSTNGNLIKTKNDSLHFEIKIGAIIDNEIVIRNNITSQQIIVKVSVTKNIESIILLDTITAIQTPYISADYYSNNVDTTTEYGDVFVSNVQNYGFATDGYNYLKNTVSWYMSDFSGGYNYYEDTVDYTFSSQTYNTYLPLQNPLRSIPYVLSGNIFEDITAVNLLELNGYTIFKKNKNLIQTVQSANYGYITKFSYVMNALNQVTEMNVSNPNGVGTSIKYNLTYY